MTSQTSISVCVPNEQDLNGLGMMILQYIEQNLADFEHKRQEALRIRGRVSVEVEKEVAVTLLFEGDRILVENGVAGDLDLHLKSSTTLLTEMLIGKTRPISGLLSGGVKLQAIPKRPIQSMRILRFLKMPPELLIQPLPSKTNR